MRDCVDLQSVAVKACIDKLLVIIGDNLDDLGCAWLILKVIVWVLLWYVCLLWYEMGGTLFFSNMCVQHTCTTQRYTQLVSREFHHPFNECNHPLMQYHNTLVLCIMTMHHEATQVVVCRTVCNERNEEFAEHTKRHNKHPVPRQ